MRINAQDIDNKKRAGVCILAFFCFFCSTAVWGQGMTDSIPSGSVKTTGEVRSVRELEHSPRKAIILSAVVPGAGQVYNKQAWKVPIIYAAIGGVGYYTYVNYTQMKFYKDEYLYRVGHNGLSQHPNDADVVATPTSNIYNLYEAYNKTFQLSVIVAAAVYGLNLIDAYVFGHLFDFQISDDLSLSVSPNVMPAVRPELGGFSGLSVAPYATLTLRF